MTDDTFVGTIARTLSVEPAQVSAAIELFDKGATIPFVARYRKDRTGNLGEGKLEAVWEANRQRIAFVQRRDSLIQTLEKEGRLTDARRDALNACESELDLEDHYSCHRRKQRPQVTASIDAGLGPLAEYLERQDPGDRPLNEFAAAFASEGGPCPDAQNALAGAEAIVAESFLNDPGLRHVLRAWILDNGKVRTCGTKLSESKPSKYKQFLDFAEAVTNVPPVKLAAIFRGVKEGMIRLEIEFDENALLAHLYDRYIKAPDSEFAPHLRATIDSACQAALRAEAEAQVIAALQLKADDYVARIARNIIKRVLTAPAAFGKSIVGVAPVGETALALAHVNREGALCASAVIAVQGDDSGGAGPLKAFLGEAQADYVAMPSGPGAHKVFSSVSAALDAAEGSRAAPVVVHAAGLKSYTTSALASAEFPGETPEVRAAVSIARRLLDPLAELVKLEPRKIAGGAYQHAANRKLLNARLQKTVASCVNRIGVDLNAATAELLSCVSGLQLPTAENIVAYRNEHGPFKSREALLQVDGVGAKVFEYAAGFLRVNDGDNPLDATAVHPEAYPLVERIAQSVNLTAAELPGNREALEAIDWAQFHDDAFGNHTVTDIRFALMHPRRKARGEFRLPEGLRRRVELKDLKAGELVEGIVTNITDFGAFVDVGAGQDGLVHLSELASRFVGDPREIVYVGEIVRVKIVEVDLDRPRISLSLKAAQPTQERRPRKPRPGAHAKPRPQGAQTRRSKQSEGPGRKSKPNGRRPGADKPRQPAKTSAPQESEPLNTQLADQLAALRDQFGK